MAKKITFGLALLVVFLGAIGFSGLKVVQHRILLNAKAPHLVSSPEPEIDFPFRKLDGSQVHLAETKGKVVFVNLWGTWCIQCVAEMPTVQALYNRFRGDPSVVFLIISRLDSPGTVSRYARLNHLDLSFYTADDADIPASMQLNQFPATFIYSPTGMMMVKHTGAADWSAPAVVSYITDLETKR
jgi:thiol-disulfide isomerase/thioredoxin